MTSDRLTGDRIWTEIEAATEADIGRVYLEGPSGGLAMGDTVAACLLICEDIGVTGFDPDGCPVPLTVDDIMTDDGGTHDDIRAYRIIGI